MSIKYHESPEKDGMVEYAGVKWMRIDHWKARYGDIWWCHYFPGEGRFMVYGSDELSDQSRVKWYRRQNL